MQPPTILSVVTPMFNEREAVDQFVARLRPVLDSLDVTYEVVVVDDGSTDGTTARVLQLREGWPQLRLVKLRRNVGHQLALAAGLRAARGQYTATIDADLQDPPEAIGEMLVTARDQNVDVVYGVRADRSTDSAFKRHTASGYYWVMRKLVGPWVSSQAGDFRLLSRQVVDILVDLPEQRPVYRLIVPSLGFPSAEVRYARAPRVAGETKYPLSKMVRLSIDSLTSFSAAPLRVATWLGVLSFLTCLLLVLAGLGAWALGVTVPGWTSLYIAVLLLGGIQLICLGLLGEYIGRIFAMSQRRPTFLVAYDTATDGPETITPSASDGAVPEVEYARHG